MAYWIFSMTIIKQIPWESLLSRGYLYPCLITQVQSQINLSAILFLFNQYLLSGELTRQNNRRINKTINYITWKETYFAWISLVVYLCVFVIYFNRVWKQHICCWSIVVWCKTNTMTSKTIYKVKTRGSISI